MTNLQTVPCHIAGMGSGIVLLDEKIVSNCTRDRQDMWVKDFIHIALDCKCAPNYNQVGVCKVNGPLDYRIIQHSG